jgi:hypothetical protein
MALKPNEIRFVANDTLPNLKGTLTEDDGAPVDLTGASVALHVKYETPLEKNATILDAAMGKWLVEWEPGDLIEGKWAYEIQVTDAAGGIRTWNRESTTDRQLTMVIDPEVA